MRIWERNNIADPQVREGGGGGGGPPGTRAEISLQSIAKTMVSQDVPLQPIEVCGGANRLLQPVNVPEGGFDSMGSPCWNRQECKLSSPKQEGVTLSTTPIPLFALLPVFENLNLLPLKT